MPTIRESSPVILTLSTIAGCIFAALAFVRNGDVSRIDAGDIVNREQTSQIQTQSIRLERLEFQIQSQGKTLDEVRSDVKTLLEISRGSK